MKYIFTLLLFSLSLTLSAQKIHQEKGKYGLKIKEQIICEPVYDTIIVSKSDKDKVVVVNRYPDSEWGVFTLDGKQVIPFSRTEIGPFSDGLARCSQLWYDLNPKDYEYNGTEQSIVNDIFWRKNPNVAEPKRYWFINSKGESVIETTPLYNYAESFHNGATIVAVKDSLDQWKSSLIDTKGV